MKYAFAGDREISCDLLKFLIAEGHSPSALLINKGKNESHANSLKEIAKLSSEYVFEGSDFKQKMNKEKLTDLKLDYIIGVHFPHIIPEDVLSIPDIGFVNLHPSYLPYNKGWHTPSWAIIDGTPYGATLHFMTEKLDQGDIIHQKKIQIQDIDTANTLYRRTLELEKEVFKEAVNELTGLNPVKTEQKYKGTSHIKKDLSSIQEIDPNCKVYPSELIDKFRALTTNKKSEAAYIRKDGKKVGIQVKLFEL